MIIDYSTSRPSISRLKAAGVTAVGRYIGWDSVPGYPSIGKNITRAEAQALVQADIAVVLAFEYDPNAAAKGASQGRPDAQLAAKQIEEVGGPPDMASYFAVDFDVPDYAPHLPDNASNARAKLGPIGDYFQTINEMHYSFEVGGYGGYYVIKRLLDAGLITKAWQTVAWSGGQMDPRVVLYQLATPPPATLLGSDVNIREHGITVEDFGQWPRPRQPVKPASATTASTEEYMPVVLSDLAQNESVVLPVPLGKSKLVLYADYGFGVGHVPPEVRVGTAPTWNKGPTYFPAWDTPEFVELPAGTTEVTIGRIDAGSTKITVDFA